MFESINQAIKEHPYLSIFFFVSTGILFTVFLSLTGLGFIPAGFGVGSFLFGEGVAATVFNWCVTSVLAGAISLHFSALFTALIDMVQSELSHGQVSSPFPEPKHLKDHDPKGNKDLSSPAKIVSAISGHEVSPASIVTTPEVTEESVTKLSIMGSPVTPTQPTEETVVLEVPSDEQLSPLLP